jgi:hypothetical protein
MELRLSRQKNPSDDQSNGQASIRSRTIILVIFLGFLLRLYASLCTHIINPDGIWYICQAKALYHGLWDRLPSCVLPFLSIYPILTAGANFFFHDWILAARSVSLFFGTVTMIPLYLLFRQFFGREISALSVLVFAVIPFLVQGSADIIRGPVYWFFLILGLYFFVRHMGKENYRLLLVLSSFSFMTAAWSRAEAVLFIFLSLFFLILTKQDKKGDRLFYFTAPIITVLCFVLFNTISLDGPLKNMFRIHEMASKFVEPVDQYRILRSNLTDLADPSLGHPLVSFLHKARNLVWLIALGTLFSYVIKSFFYPAFFIFLLGVSDIKSRLREDRRILYLVILAAAALWVLYVHLLETWFIYTRFMAAFLFPSCVFIGFGLKKISRFLESRFRLPHSMALFLVFFLLLSVSLPKNLKPREADKLVFKNMGELIAKIEGPGREIALAGHRPAIMWVSFYANMNCPDVLCPPTYDLTGIPTKDYIQFIRNLKKEGIQYVLWQEKYWSQSAFDLLKLFNPKDLKIVSEDDHPDTGRLLLFKLL